MPYKALKGLIPPFLLLGILPVTRYLSDSLAKTGFCQLPTSERQRKRFLNWSHLLSLFGPCFGPLLKPKMPLEFAPKGVNKTNKIWVHFSISFFKVLELFRCLSGAFLGVPRVSWMASDPLILQMQVFGTLKLLMALLGSSWTLLGRSVPKTENQKLPHKLFQSRQNTDPKIDPTINNSIYILSNFGGPFWGPKWSRKQRATNRQILPEPS